MSTPGERGGVILISIMLFIFAAKTHGTKSALCQLLRYLAIIVGIVNFFFLLITCNSTDLP
jgi:hypothetical protein